jgi:hypothetical protein
MRTKLLVTTLLLALSAFGQTQVNLSAPLPAPAPAPQPVMHVETIAISTLNMPQGGLSYTYGLKAVPIGSMGAIICLTSSQLGGGVVVPVNTIQPTIVFTLPSYFPYTTADVITVVYWATK